MGKFRRFLVKFLRVLTFTALGVAFASFAVCAFLYMIWGFYWHDAAMCPDPFEPPPALPLCEKVFWYVTLPASAISWSVGWLYCKVDPSCAW